MFSIRKSDTILDLGCGDGLNTFILRKMGCKKIIGVDISEYLLRIARKLNPGVEFKIASAEKLPFKSGSFNVVLVDSVFHHLSDSVKVQKEIRRVLTSGGTLCFSEPHYNTARKLFDKLTIAPISKILPFFRLRRPAFLAERALIERWYKKEESFIKKLENNGFKKEFCRYDLLGVIGKYLVKSPV